MQTRALSLVLLALVGLTALPVQARTFKIATLAPEGTTWMKEMRAGAETISERTEGRVKLKFYPGGVMGNDQSVLKKMRIGQLQGGALTGGSVASIYPDSQIYSLPFLFKSYEEVDYVRARIDARIGQGLEENGLVTVGLSEGGFAYIMSNNPIRSTEALARQKVWLPEGDIISETVFKAMNVSPIPLPIADVYTGLQTGLIDTIGSIPTAAIAFQWHTKMKALTEIPLVYLTGLLVLDKKAFMRMSDADQQVVREVMRTTFKTLDAKNRADNKSALQALKKQGIEFVKPDTEELKHWRNIARESTRSLGEAGVYSPEMLGLVNGYLQEFREQKRLANAP